MSLSVLAASASGEDRRRRRGFSQLEFDTAVEQRKERKKPVPPSEAPQPKPPEAKRAPAVSAGMELPPPGVDLYSEDEGALAVYPHVAPKLKGGPDVDPGSSDSLTSLFSWERGASPTCVHPVGEDEYCKKALALREILYRFSGTNEFYEAHCLEPCRRAGFKPAMHAVDFAEPDGGDLKILDRVAECRYQLSRREGAPWLLLRVASVECVCIPEGCERRLVDGESSG